MSHVLAVDFGGTKTAWADVDPEGKLTCAGRDRAWKDWRAAAAGVASLARGATGAGVIIPGIFNPVDGTAWAPNLWGSDPVPLRAELEDKLGYSAVIDSDRSGYVLGEQWLGVARGLRDVIFLAIGTGIGAGIVSGGRLLRGAHGIAGAVGWMALAREWKAEYAAAGCWESEASGPAIARGASLQDLAEFTAMGVANLISTLNPEMVVLGGGVVQAGYPLVLEVRRRVARWAQPVALGKTRIEKTTLEGNAGLLGAARLALLAKGIHKENDSIYVG